MQFRPFQPSVLRLILSNLISPIRLPWPGICCTVDFGKCVEVGAAFEDRGGKLPGNCATSRKASMTAESLIGLIEEMVDLKIQQYAESTMKPSPEISRILQEKKQTDYRRLQQIKAELIRSLQT